MSKKILIVEDDKDFMWILKQNFSNQPFSVLFAEDGEKGLSTAEKENPDLILIDISMPKMNGIEMAKKIKEKGIKSQMIFLTNLKDENHISQAMELTGGADYIVKADVPVASIVSRVISKLEAK
jgi:DNA-binding response OmpR family regulator